MKIKNFFLVLIVTVFVSACTDVGVLTVVTPPDIIIHVNNAGVANITTPASGKCKISNQGKNGCLHFGADETGLINFKLTGPPDWAFDTFQICKVSANGNICDLNIWERIEFVVTDEDGTAMLIPDQSGSVDLAQLGESLDEFILLNQNTFAQEYYYSIDACDATVSPKKCALADPPIENGGKH